MDVKHRILPSHVPCGYNGIGSIIEIIHAGFDLHESAGIDIVIPRSFASLCNKWDPRVPCGLWSLDRQFIICFICFITCRQQNWDFEPSDSADASNLPTHTYINIPTPTHVHVYTYLCLAFPSFFFLFYYFYPFFLVLLLLNGDIHRSDFKFQTAVLSVLCVMFQVHVSFVVNLLNVSLVWLSDFFKNLLLLFGGTDY
jgi:hypothetical protein